MRSFADRVLDCRFVWNVNNEATGTGIKEFQPVFKNDDMVDL